MKNVDVRVSKFNRTTYIINGNATLAIPLSDDYNLRYEFFGMQGNEYRKIYPDMVEKKMCTFLRNSKLFYHTLPRHSNLPEQDENMCPIKEGDYYIRNYMATTGGVQAIPFSLKLYKIKFTYYILQEMELSGAVYIEADYKNEPLTSKMSLPK